MFLYLSRKLMEQAGGLGPLRLFEYITFRAGGAAFSAFIIALVFGGFTSRLLRHVQAAAPNRLEGLVEDDAETVARKEGVPSMGGILILAATVVSILLWGRIGDPLVLLFLGLLVFLGLIGFLDDYLKIRRQSGDGLPGKWKILAQLVIAVVAVYCLDQLPETKGVVRQLYMPFVKHPVTVLPLAGALAFGAFIVISSSNAVNLTDGMDGLAIGCTAICATAYAIFAYVCGHAKFADYLLVPYISNCGEVTVIALAIAGASLGFLWHNCFPASMFMGDTGSLALGGAVGLIAVLVRQELLLAVVGGIFVIEAGSVLLQTGWYKLSRRLFGTPQRLFRCAPIHHHFKKKGWPETQIVIRFWIIALALAAAGVASLKLR